MASRFLRYIEDGGEFTWEVLSSWSGRVTGGVIVALIWLWSTAYQAVVSRPFGLGIAGLFLIVACFSVWRTERKKRLELESPFEANDSLRRRCIALTDEIEFWLNSQMDGLRKIENSDPNDNSEMLRRQRDYQQDMINNYQVRFQRTVISIVHELKSKGVYLNSPCTGIDLSEIKYYMDGRDVHWLRSMAYKLDHTDKAVKF